MSLQLVIAAVEKNTEELLQQMVVDSDAVLVKQCNHDAKHEMPWNHHTIQVVEISSRGVGINRNTGILHSTADILVFADQDMIYEKDYAAKIETEFTNHPEADMILFNVEVGEDRKTYENTVWKRVHWYNCGRYGAVSIAIKRKKLLESRVMFSQLFGGGAKYSAGEDSLFLKDLMDRGIRVYASPIVIGREDDSESTWFKGYDEKFFYDRGVLYHQLYGCMAKVWALRFLLAHKARLTEKIPLVEAFQYMEKGIKNK